MTTTAYRNPNAAQSENKLPLDSPEFWAELTERAHQLALDRGSQQPPAFTLFDVESPAPVNQSTEKPRAIYIRLTRAEYSAWWMAQPTNRIPFTLPLQCRCPQRVYPHDVKVHSDLRRESYNPARRFIWPWSLASSARIEPSAESGVAA